jgi:Sulfotransferase family
MLHANKLPIFIEYFSICFLVPILFKKDNPNAKAIFVVRDPINRLISHFKFVYNQLSEDIQNLNHLVEIALLAQGNVFFEKRQAAVDVVTALETDEAFGKDVNLYKDTRFDELVKQLEG